ncbi:MAG: hypothetical protein EBV69_12985 [Oxalobacteraceae bacterium]|nr:hypothetical protein [Oxalobacteraceae bacterium]
MLHRHNKQLPLLLRKLILEMTTMRSIPHPPSAAITVGQMHLGARLARYQVSVYRALQARDHRLALDFYAAKARSEG